MALLNVYRGEFQVNSFFRNFPCPASVLPWRARGSLFPINEMMAGASALSRGQEAAPGVTQRTGPTKLPGMTFDGAVAGEQRRSIRLRAEALPPANRLAPWRQRLRSLFGPEQQFIQAEEAKEQQNKKRRTNQQCVPAGSENFFLEHAAPPLSEPSPHQYLTLISTHCLSK
jgi:hypothetical protein